MRAALQRRGDGGEGDEEAGAEIGLEAVDEADDAGEGHWFLDVEVEPVEVVRAEEIAQGRVVRFEARGGGGVEAGEGALGGAAEHGEDGDAGGLEEGDFGPERGVFGRGGGVVVQGDAAGGVVEVEGRDDEVGDGDEVGGFGEEGQEGDEGVAVVVGLVVEDDAGLVRGGAGGRHWWGEVRCGVGGGGGMRICYARLAVSTARIWDLDLIYWRKNYSKHRTVVKALVVYVVYSSTAAENWQFILKTGDFSLWLVGTSSPSQSPKALENVAVKTSMLQASARLCV